MKIVVRCTWLGRAKCKCYVEMGTLGWRMSVPETTRKLLETSLEVRIQGNNFLTGPWVSGMSFQVMETMYLSGGQLGPTEGCIKGI